MEQDTKKLTAEVLTGIAFYNAAAAAVIAVVYPRKVLFLGLFFGMVLAMAMFLSMAVVLERALATGSEGKLQVRMVMSTVVRYLLLIFAFLAAARFFADKRILLGMLIGLLGLKIGTLLQPKTDRIFKKIFREAGEIPSGEK